MIILCRVLRVGTFLRELPEVKVFELTMRHLVGSLVSLGLLLYTVYMLYGEISCQLFGGWISY